MKWPLVSQILIGVTLLGVVLAGLGALGTDIYLASTQWLLVSAVAGILGVWVKLQK